MSVSRFNRTRTARLAAACAIAVAVVISQASLAIADGSLEKIKKAGKIVVGTEAAFPPFEFVREGKIVGFNKDVLDLIVSDLGVQLEQLDVPWQGLFPGLLAGKFDFLASALTMYERSTTKFAFTMPTAEGSPSILKRKGDAKITRTADLSGRSVATQIGTGGERILRELDTKFKAEGKPGIDLKLFTSGPEAFLALANGQADAAVSLLPTLLVLASKQPDVYEVVGPVLEERLYLGWAARPEDKDLRDYLSAKIKGLRDNGKLYELQKKWFGFKMDIPDKGYMSATSL